MFLFMGLVHIVASFLLLLNGSEQTLVYTQLLGGLFEIAVSLGVYFYTDVEEFI